MKTLINKVADKFNAKPADENSISFSFGDDDYCLTDGTLYAVCDGQFLPGFKKVKTMRSLENFVSARA